MGLVDDYINNNYDFSIVQLSEDLGLDQTYLRSIMRIRGYKRPIRIDIPNTSSEEIGALFNLISIRKTGWAVDIAKQRIKFLCDKNN